MKKLVILAMVLGLIISLTCVGEGPVAKVQLRDIETHMPLSRYYAYDFAWVNVLEVYDADEFKIGTEKISDDGQRANIVLRDYSGLKNGETYYFYTFDGYELTTSKRWYIGRRLIYWMIFTFIAFLFEGIVLTVAERAKK